MAETSIIDELILMTPVSYHYNPTLGVANQTSRIYPVPERRTESYTFYVEPSKRSIWKMNRARSFDTDRPAGWSEEEHSNQERPMMKGKVGFISANARRIRAK